ncbi:serine protease inhibitor swm-1-like [Engystomops pustulosus]|uniref:serine protease inhibitor swm-1-like n=1 Tax=Engystomops pustulosus TaxID=76066 RepID=UPI003AFA7894
MARTAVVLLSCLSLVLLMIHAKDTQDCEDGKEFSECYGHCQTTCDNFNLPCTKDCRSGCVCKDDKVIDKTGKCVRKEDC